jgi:aminoglycoside phosphotransferase (APT) family kinase protein
VNLERTLSGQAGQQGVRDLLLGEGATAVRDALQEMVGTDRSLSSLRLGRVHFKAGRNLRAYYEVGIDGVREPVPVAVAWLSDGSAPTATEIASAQTRLTQAGVPTPIDRLWAIDQRSGMLVLAAPLDPAFPGLAMLSDPRRVPEAVGMCAQPAVDGAGQYTIRSLRYRPGQRHVLSYTSRRGPDAFAKLYKPGKAVSVAASVTAFADLLQAAELPGLRVVRPGALLADADAILYLRLPGTPLSRWVRAGQHPGQSHLRRAGRLMKAMHSVAPPPDSRLRERDLDGEVSAVMRACAPMIGLEPKLGAVAKGVVERAQERLAELEPEPNTVVHGDMKADHLLLGSQTIGLLDTDRCALADPALDIGKLLADLRWWSSVAAGAGSDAIEADLLAGYGAEGPRLARARIYASLLVVKMAARRVSLVSETWAPDTARLLTLAGEALELEMAR